MTRSVGKSPAPGRWPIALWIGAVLAVLLAGCATRAPGPAPAATTASIAPITDDDACAERMHDLAGLLLLDYNRAGELPARLSDLGPALGGMPAPPLVCPVSGRPYVYNPVGIYLPERRAHLVLYDPAPSHAGYRWCIVAEDPQEGVAPIFKVIALPESFFVLR